MQSERLKEKSLFHHCFCEKASLSFNKCNILNQLVKGEFEAESVKAAECCESESDPAGWWIMTLSTANESGSALNPFSKSIKRANKSRAVTGLHRDHSRRREAALSGQQAQAGGHYRG